MRASPAQRFTFRSEAIHEAIETKAQSCKPRVLQVLGNRDDNLESREDPRPDFEPHARETELGSVLKGCYLTANDQLYSVGQPISLQPQPPTVGIIPRGSYEVTSNTQRRSRFQYFHSLFEPWIDALFFSLARGWDESTVVMRPGRTAVFKHCATSQVSIPIFSKEAVPRPRKKSPCQSAKEEDFFGGVLGKRLREGWLFR
jgi:hypothetical protein